MENIGNRMLQNRQDFEKMALDLLEPLKAYYSEGGARLDLGVTGAVYDQNAVWAEAFLRPLWGLIPLWAGGSRLQEWQERYRKGLAAGTDPEGTEYWGGFHDVDQRFVEMAAVAYGMLMVPEVLWEPLEQMEKMHLALWLDGINHYACPPCNWMFFGILVNVALQSQGMDYSRTRLQEYLDYIESCYEGNGWYLDGQNGERDYYVSFAFHYYSLIYARFMEKQDPVRCREYKRRARIFAKEFVLWFAEDGAALAYGRSLTYRFAQVSFFSMCVSCQIEVLPYPVMKGLIVRHFRYWLKQPVFDHGGILTIGYGYPNLLMSEQYNGPGSPYWGMKAFAFLSLPAEHDFWKLPEAPLPPLSSAALIANGTMLMQRLNGQIYGFPVGRRLPHHHVHTEEKYSKFVYSSRYAFSVPRSMRTLEEAAPDNMLAVEVDGRICTKGMVRNPQSGQDWLSVEWSPCAGIEIKTEIHLLPDGHRRTHRITSGISCRVYDLGFAVPDHAEQCPERQLVRCRSGNGQDVLLEPSPNTSLLYPKTVIPGIAYEVKKGTQTIETDFLLLAVEKEP